MPFCLVVIEQPLVEGITLSLRVFQFELTCPQTSKNFESNKKYHLKSEVNHLLHQPPLKAIDLRTFWSQVECDGGLFVCPHQVFYQLRRNLYCGCCLIKLYLYLLCKP